LLALAAVAGLAVVAALGCSGETAPTLVIPRWRLEVEGIPGESAVVLPAHLDARVPARPGRYHLRAEVDLPPTFTGRTLVLALESLPAIVELHAAGAVVPALDDAPWDRYRSAGPHRFRLSPADTARSPLVFDLVVLHRWRQSTWIDAAPRLSATNFGDRAFLRKAAFNYWTAAAGAWTACFVALLYLLVFLLDRRRESHGWLALGAAGCGVYPAAVLGVTQALLGSFDLPVLAVSLCVAWLASIYFVHVHFGAPRPWRVWPIVVGGFAVGCALAREPFAIGRLAPAPTVAFTIFTIVYQIATLWRIGRGRRRPLNARTVLSCWAVLGVASAVDFARWLGMGDLLGGYHPGALGLMLFLLFFSAVLSREHTFLLGQAELLNEELRRQIRDRSHELSLALAGTTTLPPARADAAPRAPLLPDQVIEDRYRIVRTLGAGGMGTVYEVHRLRDGRALALKVLRGAAKPTSLARFAREAELAVQVDHPNVVAITDVGVMRGGDLFLVMELVDGRSLEEHRGRYGELAWATAVVEQAASGLAAIHERGIVHRDLKPSNILVCDGGTAERPAVKIADFGIAVLARDDEPRAEAQARLPADATVIAASAGLHASPRNDRITQTGVILGSPPYMAPEVFAQAGTVSPSADIFSLGIVAYQILSGRYPVWNGIGVRPGAPGGRATPLGQAAPAIPAGLAALVDRCLDPSPDQRPPAVEVAGAFSRTNPT
jgi:serine/threonine-protein kinase